MKLLALSQKKSLPETFQEFLDTQYSVSRTTTQSIRDTMVNHMKAFSYNPQDQRNSHDSRIKAQLTRLRKKLDEQYMIQQAVIAPQQLQQLSQARKRRASSSGNLQVDDDDFKSGYLDRTKRRKRSKGLPPISPSPINKSVNSAGGSEETVHDPIVADNQSMSGTKSDMKMKRKSSMMGSGKKQMSTSSRMSGKSMDSVNTMSMQSTETTKMVSKKTMNSVGGKPNIVDDDGNGAFDDEFDPNHVPAVYEEQNALWKLKSTESVNRDG